MSQIEIKQGCEEKAETTRLGKSANRGLPGHSQLLKVSKGLRNIAWFALDSLRETPLEHLAQACSHLDF